MLIIRRPDPMPRPRVSGKRSALLLGLCFGVSAVLVPVAAHLAHWVEFELVLAAWWFVWVVALSWLLVNAHVVERDGEGSFKRPLTDGALPGCGPELADGCLLGTGCCPPFESFAIVAVIIVGLLFVVEFLLPGIAFLLYVVVRAMLARVTNDHRNCEGHPPLALLWGAIWATAYTAPIALIVWSVHILSRHPLR